MLWTYYLFDVFKPNLLQDVKLSHHWGTDIITIQDNGIIRTITITKHLNSQTKRLEVFYVMISKMGSQKKKKTLHSLQNLICFLLILLPY